MIWYCRNLFIFENQTNAHDLLAYKVLNLARDYNHNLALKAVARRSIPNIQFRQVAWIPPLFNWKKVYTDGSFLSDSSLASCGGIARDHNGNFIAAWSLNLGHCTITATELWLYSGVFSPVAA